MIFPCSGIEPGYLRYLIPAEPPLNPESWDQIMKDVEVSVVQKKYGV